MLSIIISSYQPEFYSALKKNIAETIGIPYEIIKIDNPNLMGICEAYNKGASLSKYDYLLFVHEDVIFHTNNWGGVIVDIFNEDENVGLIGVAGSKVKTKAPSGWWSCPENYKVINILQHVNSKVEKWDFGENEKVTEVAAIDGVFMITKKTADLYFDERLKGFHNYDLFLSTFIKRKNEKIVVTKDILIEHFSNGNVNFDWFKKALTFYKLYKKNLPLYVDCNQVELRKLEIKNSENFIKNYTFYKTDFQIMKYWFSFFFKNPILKFHAEHLFLLSYKFYKKCKIK